MSATILGLSPVQFSLNFTSSTPRISDCIIRNANYRILERQRTVVKFSPGYNGLSSLNSNCHTGSSGLVRPWDPRLAHHHGGLLIVGAEKKNFDSSSKQSEQSQSGKERGIPPALYRPFPFPDVQYIVRGLDPRKRMIYGLAFVALLAGVTWLRNLGVAGLVDDTEPLFVEAARQMIVTGDYLTPQFNALPRFDKPILIYWLMAISVKLFGNEVWAFRLPSCLCATGLLTGLFLTVNHFGLHLSREMKIKAESMKLSLRDQFFVPAIISAASFALNLQVVAWGSTALSDMLLTSSMAASLLSFFWAYAGKDHNPVKYSWGYPLSAFFLGIACLSKGPIGILFPVCVCACFLLCTQELGNVILDELPKVKGILLILLINLPWYGMMFLKHGSMFLSTFFGYHNIERFLRGVNHHGGKPWFYGLAVVLVVYFPWSLSLPSALIDANPWKHRYLWRDYPRSKRLSLFATIWLIIGFFIFALSSSQLPSYYLPVAPAVAILVASQLSLPAGCHSSGLATGLVPAFLYQILAGLCFLLPGLLASSSSAIIVEIGNQMNEGYLHKIAFGFLAVAGVLATRTEEYASAYCPDLDLSDTSPEHVPYSKKTLLPLWVLHTATILAITSAFVTPCFQFVDGIRQLPLRQLAVKAAKVQQPGEALIMVGERMPSVVFYSKLPTAFFDTTVEASNVLKESASKLPSALVITNEVWEGSLQPAIIAQEQSYSLLRVVVPSQGQPSRYDV